MGPSKGWMKVVGIGAGLALLATACSQDPVVVAQSAEEGLVPAIGITVSGTGEVTGTPDTLTVDLGVSVLRDSASQAISEAAALAQQMIDALREAGIEERDIQTRQYSIFPEYDYSDETPEVIGYRVSNVLTVTVRNVEGAGDIIDAATATAGDDVTVQGIRFDLEDNEALLDAARAAAWEDATGKATQLAELAGLSLGRPLAISETVSSVPPPIPFEEQARSLAAADTPIEPGQLGVTVNIEVRFATES